MNPRLLIVDDETPARDRLRMLLADIAEDCPHTIVGEAGSARDALDTIMEHRPDIVLLDVQMPGMTGIELASHLMKLKDWTPSVIFITAFEEFALKAFEVHAVDYLLKPVRAARLADAIRRATAARLQSSDPRTALAAAIGSLHAKRRHFSVQERGKVILVPIIDVIYLKAELKYVTVRTREREYLIEESLTSIEEEFEDIFVRVHRSTLVARNAIVGVERAAQPAEGEEGEKAQESWQVVMRDVGERLPISRRQWGAVKALIKP
ncbi:LytR/AlgR family response regulator transcription factor [Noviherbaspirillum galbum]|uniref:Response regulator transcription factor n=1 Tax=Noviherbaspirillum galbum TaxID=2709383 RepID=A0A6B3SRY0_9BURK|nr:LytTR family DNA-binding domain-containing protein [Noviherbaspirillum galbum]NEX61546.1 response regulator transcription factor [Noviherbaspirillum galbum]